MCLRGWPRHCSTFLTELETLMQEQKMDQLDQITDTCTLPDGACRSGQALCAGAAQFKVDLTEHIHLENIVLFPRFEATPQV